MDANVNGSDIIVPTKRLEKRKKITLPTPVKENITESYDFTQTIEYIDSSGITNNTDIEEISTKGSKISKMILKYQ